LYNYLQIRVVVLQACDPCLTAPCVIFNFKA
jgi:hypothetical protein